MCAGGGGGHRSSVIDNVLNPKWPIKANKMSLVLYSYIKLLMTGKKEFYPN